MRPEEKVENGSAFKLVDFTAPKSDGTPNTLANLLAVSTNTVSGITGAAVAGGLTNAELSRVFKVQIMGEEEDGATERAALFYGESTSMARKQPIAAGAEKEFKLTWEGLKDIFITAGTTADETHCIAEVYMSDSAGAD